MNVWRFGFTSALYVAFTSGKHSKETYSFSENTVPGLPETHGAHLHVTRNRK